jgi:hypothetical protein
MRARGVDVFQILLLLLTVRSCKSPSVRVILSTSVSALVGVCPTGDTNCAPELGLNLDLG